MLIGLAVLLLGTLVYLVDRVPEQTLAPDSIGLFSPVPSLFGVVGHNLPTFTHVFAFILLTAALLNRSKRTSITVCVGWFVVDSAFEVGQHAYFAQWLSTFVPSWFQYIPILEKTKGYFVYGTFDPVDLETDLFENS